MGKQDDPLVLCNKHYNAELEEDDKICDTGLKKGTKFFQIDVKQVEVLVQQ